MMRQQALIPAPHAARTWNLEKAWGSAATAADLRLVSSRDLGEELCECLNHADFPERVLSRFLPYVAPGGMILASMFDKSASRARWRRLEAAAVDVEDQTKVTNARGQSWTVKALRPHP